MNEFYNHPRRNPDNKNNSGRPPTQPQNTNNGQYRQIGTGGGYHSNVPNQQYRQYQGSNAGIPQNRTQPPSVPVRKNTVRRRKKRVPVLIPIVIILLLAVGIGFACDYGWREYEKYTHPLGFSEIVESASREFGVPEYVIYAVIKTESGFREDAVSYRGAVGLMQIMPDTYEWLTTHTKEEYTPDRLSAPEVNIRYGTYFLSWLYEEFGSWEIVYAAYNAGFVRVRGWLEDERYFEDGRLVNIPIEETRNYVVKVSDAVQVYRRLYEM